MDNVIIMPIVEYVFAFLMMVVFVWGGYMDFIKKWEDNNNAEDK